MNKNEDEVIEVSPDEYRKQRLEGWPSKAAAIIGIVLAIFVLLTSSYLNIHQKWI